jgi:Zn-dependent protease
MMEKLPILILWMVPFIFSLSFHEYAHAWTAHRFGDQTAKMLGRLSMNPVVHVDPLGTIAFPVFGFLTGFAIIGWAKPVPVNERNLANPKTQAKWVAAAGPLSNLILAIGFTLVAIVLHQTTGISPTLGLSKTTSMAGIIMTMLVMGIYVNVLLGFFNLLPIPPLDGSHIIKGFFPALAPAMNRLQQVNPLVLLFFLYILLKMGVLHILLTPAFFVINLLMSLI